MKKLTLEEIRATEYCEEFDQIRKRIWKSRPFEFCDYRVEFDELRANRLIKSYYKYGPLKENYGNDLGNALETYKMCISKYLSTKNTEYLVDATNYLMIEYMFPKHATEAYGSSYDYIDLVGSVGYDYMKAQELCIKAYIEKGDIAHLPEAANCLMVEFILPTVKGAHFKATCDEKDSAGWAGTPYTQMVEASDNFRNELRGQDSDREYAAGS